MKTTMLASLFTLAVTISASPFANPEPVAEAEPVTLEARADQYFTFWTGINYSGTKSQVKNPGNGDCANFSNTFQDSISSAGPTSGLVCTLYRDNNCAGSSVTINNPGISDLRTVNFNDVASSFKCAYYV